MQVHDIFALLSLWLAAPASGFKAGVVCLDTGALVGRRGSSPADRLVVPRRCTRRYILHELHISPLVARSGEEIPRPTRTEEESSGFKTVQIPSLANPSSSQELLRSKRPSSPQGPAKKPNLGTLSTSRQEQPESGAEPRPLNHPKEKSRHYPKPMGSRKPAMWLYLAPDPDMFEGVKNLKTGKQSYYRRLAGGDETTERSKVGEAHKASPIPVLVKSEGQRERIGGLTPEKYEVMTTTGHVGHSRKSSHQLREKELCCAASRPLQPAAHARNRKEEKQNNINMNMK